MTETLEEPKFEKIEEHRRFEVRHYSDTIQARVSMSDIDRKDSSQGFRKIAGYIFGKNEHSQQIAMTAPVHLWKEENYGMMAFTMPSEYTISDLPLPNNSEVMITEVKGQVMAAMKFSGFSGRKKCLRKVKKLEEGLKIAGYIASGEPILAVYDNPATTLPFMRRNEILIPLKWY